MRSTFKLILSLYIIPDVTKDDFQHASDILGDQISAVSTKLDGLDSDFNDFKTDVEKGILNANMLSHQSYAAIKSIVTF